MIYIYHGVTDFELGTTEFGVPMAKITSAGITTLEIYETDGIHRYNQTIDTKMYHVGGVKGFPRVKYSRGSQVLEIEID